MSNSRSLPTKHSASQTRRKRLSARFRFAILQRDGFRCRYCGRTAEEMRLEVEHQTSLYDGGTDDDTNLVTACWECNSGKGRDSLTLGKPDTPLLQVYSDGGVLIAHGISYKPLLKAVQSEMERGAHSCGIYEVRGNGLELVYDAWRIGS